MRVIFFAWMCCYFAGGVAFADMIEVRGKGVIDGKIIFEDGASIEFKNAWGEVSTYAKKDVLFIERTTDDSSRSKWGAGKEFDFDVKSLALAVDGIWHLLDWTKTALLEFFIGDSEGLNTAAAGAVGDVMAVKSGANGFAVLGIAGLVLMVAGFLGAVVFGFQLVIAAFEDNFLWGLILIANGAAYYAPKFDGALQLLTYFPFVGTVVFIMKKWGTTRSPVVAQIFSVNLVLLGFWMLRLSL